MNRRVFLRTAAWGATGWWFLEHSRSAWSYQANEKMNVALVGVGDRGRGYVNKIARANHNLVAVCDVNQRRAESIVNLPPSVHKYQDFRTLFDEMDRQIDAVVVVTTDHNHAAVAAAAMKRGKHVYCEKPLTHDVGEALALRQIANERKGLMTQMGNQGMSTDTFRRVLEQVQQGAVGEVREVHVWFSGFGGSGPRPRPTETQAAPEHLDWDLFLGPVSFRPYHSNYVSAWGSWREFGAGMLGGGGTHSIHMAFKGLNIGALWEGKGQADARIRVEAEFPGPCPDNYPRWEIVHFDIPARGALPPVRINWYDGPEADLAERGILERMEKIAGRPLDWKGGWAPLCGSLLVGSKGVVHTNPHNSMCALLPEKEFPNQGGPPQTIPASGPQPTISDGAADQQQVTEWADACKGGRVPFSNFDYAGPVTELLLLGNIATLTGKPLEFDPVACKITNNDEADRAIRPVRREGWSL
jgi:ActR/RegA family two-component response regulator